MDYLVVLMEKIVINVDNGKHLRRQEGGGNEGNAVTRNKNDTMCIACREQGNGTDLDKVPCRACIKIFHAGEC